MPTNDYFFFNANATFLVSAFRTSTPGPFVATCVVTIALGFLLELVSFAKDYFKDARFESQSSK